MDTPGPKENEPQGAPPPQTTAPPRSPRVPPPPLQPPSGSPIYVESPGRRRGGGGWKVMTILLLLVLFFLAVVQVGGYVGRMLIGAPSGSARVGPQFLDNNVTPEIPSADDEMIPDVG